MVERPLDDSELDIQIWNLSELSHGSLVLQPTAVTGRPPGES